MSGCIRFVLHHCWRGTRNLHGVGEHPGNFLIVFFVIAGTIAGAGKEGAVGALLGFLAAACIFGPIYLWGAYERSLLSEQISERE